MNSEKLLLLIHDLVSRQHFKVLRSLISVESQGIFVIVSNSKNGHYLEIEMDCNDNLIKINCLPRVEMTEDELINQIQKLLSL